MVDDAGDPGPQRDAIPIPAERVTSGRLWSIGVMIGVVMAGVVGVYILLTLNPQSTFGQNEVIVLIAGFVTVTLVLYMGTMVLRALDLGSPAEALGMPEGSIRALIAMSLILIFAIVGFFVLKSGDGQAGASHGVTQAQIDAMRTDGTRIVSQRLIDVQPVPVAGQERYDIETVLSASDDSHDFALQLLTTVSTLVVAVAGFYFGAQSVDQATKTMKEQQTLLRRPPPGAAPTIVGAEPDANAAAAADDGAGDGTDEPEVSEVDSVGDDDDEARDDVLASAEEDAAAAAVGAAAAAGPQKGPATGGIEPVEDLDAVILDDAGDEEPKGP
jgi:hypothetical protein